MLSVAFRPNGKQLATGSGDDTLIVWDAVVLWGEFGRTPKINSKNSRDHWPRVNACVLAGGGMRTGQVIGETNKYAEEPVKRPVKFQEVFATLYHNMGLDAHGDRIFDGSGTPRYPVDHGNEPLHELV